MTAQQYDAVNNGLEKAGVDQIPGLLSHSCYGAEGKLRVHDIWESQQAFDAMKPVLFAEIASVLGALAVEPIIEPVHNFFVPAQQ
jgi:hypothetical protein